MMRIPLKMKIKRILNDEWDKLFKKPLIFMGFFLSGTDTIGLALNADGVVMCSDLFEKMHSKQNFFQELVRRFPNAPITLSILHTEKVFSELQNWDRVSPINVNFLLKGECDQLNHWEQELNKFFHGSGGAGVNFSNDNPINCSWIK